MDSGPFTRWDECERICRTGRAYFYPTMGIVAIGEVAPLFKAEFAQIEIQGGILISYRDEDGNDLRNALERDNEAFPTALRHGASRHHSPMGRARLYGRVRPRRA